MRSALLLILILTIPCFPETKAPKLGGFGLGSSADQVVRTLGKPVESLGPAPDPLSDLWVWDWTYPERGISFYVQGEFEDGPQLVRSIQVKAPCDWAFSDVCSVGTPLSEVREKNPQLGLFKENLWIVSDPEGVYLRAYSIKAGLVEGLYLGPKSPTE